MGLGFIGDVLGEITGSTAAAEAATAGAEKGAEALTESTQANIDFQKWLWGQQKDLQESIYAQQTEGFQPYTDAGGRALGAYEEQIGQPFTAESMQLDPGYQFRLAEGQKAIERSAAARGMQLSGATLKGLGRYAQDYASGEFQNAYARRQQGLANLYNLASMGQASAAGQAQAGGIMGSNILQAGSQMGGAVGQSILAGGQAQANLQNSLGQIGAAQAMAPWNTLMQVGSLAAQFTGGQGSTVSPAPPTFPTIPSSNINIGFQPTRF